MYAYNLGTCWQISWRRGRGGAPKKQQQRMRFQYICMSMCDYISVYSKPQKSSATQTTATTFRIYVCLLSLSFPFRFFLSLSLPIFVFHFLCSPTMRILSAEPTQPYILKCAALLNLLIWFVLDILL